MFIVSTKRGNATLVIKVLTLFRLTAMKRELKVKELHLLDATRRRFLKHQQDLRASQIQRLDQEINRKVNFSASERTHSSCRACNVVHDVELFCFYDEPQCSAPTLCCR